MVVVLAPLRAEDIADVTRIAHTVWQEHFVPLVGATQVAYMTARRYDDADWRQDLDAAGRGCTVARLDGRPVGHLRWRLRGDVLRIAEVHLLADARGSGLVDALLARAEADARAHGRTRLVLWVNRENARAVRAYTRCGFTAVGQEDIDIGGGFVCRDFRMEKRLP